MSIPVHLNLIKTISITAPRVILYLLKSICLKEVIVAKTVADIALMDLIRKRDDSRNKM